MFGMIYDRGKIRGLWFTLAMAETAAKRYSQNDPGVTYSVTGGPARLDGTVPVVASFRNGERVAS